MGHVAFPVAKMDHKRRGAERCSTYLEDGIPGRSDTWLITMVSFRPLNRVDPLPNGLSMAYKWG